MSIVQVNEEHFEALKAMIPDNKATLTESPVMFSAGAHVSPPVNNPDKPKM